VRPGESPAFAAAGCIALPMMEKRTRFLKVLFLYVDR
jgi:hypothetical protein